MPLKTKLLIILTAFTLVPIMLFGGVVYLKARDILQAVRIAQLNALADLKKDKIETFFIERRYDIREIQNIRIIKENMPVISRLRDPRNAEYQRAKAALDVRLAPLRETHGYVDIMLIDKRGAVVYVGNSAHEAQVGRHLAGKATFEAAKEDIAFSDIILPEDGMGSIEIIGAGPVHDERGEFIGVAAIEIDMGPVYKSVLDNQGLGKTGEALIVRKQGDSVLFLSPLREEPDAAMQKITPFTGDLAFPAQQAALGETGSGIAVDYSGRDVLAAWRFLPFLRWGLVTKIDAGEAFEPARQLRTSILIIELLMALLGIGAASAIAKSITRPVLALQKGMDIIGSGNLDHKVGTGARDEIGRLSRHIDGMTENLKKVTASRDELNAEIAERRRAEEALRESEKRFRTVADLTYNWEYWVGPDQQFLYIAPACERVTGWRPEDFKADPRLVEDIVHPGDRELFRDHQHRFHGGADWRDMNETLFRIIRRDGEERWIAHFCRPVVGDDGVFLGRRVSNRDVTEQTKAEDEILNLNRTLEDRVAERTAQLEAANRELESFAYSVSHDLRSPLRSIDGFSLALLEDYGDRLDDGGRNFLERIRNATLRMGQIIDDLLKLSRVTRMEMKQEHVDLSGLVRGLAGQIARNHPERPADFIIADGLAARGDERLLAIALENLLSNAWKFSIKAPRTVIEFGTVRQDGETVFFVKDNGAGFDMAFADKLFNPFQRLHRESDFAGTGIGLATVKRIINRHGGNVWITGEVGKGTTVYFTL